MKHKCRNCGKIKDEKYMQPYMAIENGVVIEDLYPESNKKNKVTWECGDCDEIIKKAKQKQNIIDIMDADEKDGLY